jgi:hypothetical protein
VTKRGVTKDEAPADRGEYRQAAGAFAAERYSGQLQSYQ